MQKNYQGQIPIGRKLARLLPIILFTGSLLLCSQVEAKSRFEVNDNDTAEKKVDYLEQIYFSGGNKEYLTGRIQATAQSLEDKAATLSVAKQYAFLKGIQQSADNAGGACDIEELLAAGIYNIDANEAVQQGIPKPGKKATENANGALNAVNDLSRTANDAAYAGWYLSNGNIKGFGAASKIGGAAATVNIAARTFSGFKKIFKGIMGDKPCGKVDKKDVAIGEHKAPPPPTDVKTEIQTNTAQQPVIAAPVPNAGTTKLTIKSVTFNQMNTLKSAIEKIAGVTSVSTVGFSENIAVISVASNIKSDELANKVLEASKPLTLEVAGLSPQEITLVKK